MIYKILLALQVLFLGQESFSNKLKFTTRFNTRFNTRMHTKSMSKSKSKSHMKMKSKSKTSLKTSQKSKMTLKSKEPLQEQAQNEFSDIVAQSWGKFLIKDKNKQITQQNLQFYVNEEYNQLLNQQYDKEAKDQHGLIDVPNKFSFWMIIMNGQLYVLNQRRNIDQKVIQNLKLEEIEQNWTDEHGIERKGVEELELESGFCMTIKLQDQYVQPSQDMWLVCLETGDLRKMWVKSVNSSLDLNLATFTPPPGEGAVAVIRNMFDNELGHPDKPVLPAGEETPKVEEQFHILSDWSQCTLACGGGSQTQQRACPPQMPGQPPCNGSVIINRPCNQQPCPQELEVEGHKRTVPMVLRALEYTKHPQRFERCIVMEYDVDIQRDDLDQFVNKPRIPQRLVVNNQTLTCFETFDYSHVSFTVPLNSLKFQIDAEHRDCLQVWSGADSKIKHTMCAMQNLQTDHFDWIEKLKKEINFFQTKCLQHLPLYEPKQDKQLLNLKQQEIMEEMGAVATENVTQKRMVQDSSQENEEMGHVTDSALQELAKEIQLQSRLENEQTHKDEEEDKGQMVTIEQEKDKLEQIHRKEEVATEQQAGLGMQSAKKQQIEEMQKQIKLITENLRMRSLAKMKQIQQLHELNAKEAKQEGDSIRIKTAFSVMQANFQGDKKRCNAKNTENQIKQYCVTAYKDYEDIQSCQDADNFCYACCDHEFGALKVSQRDDCYNSQCGGPKKQYAWVPLK